MSLLQKMRGDKKGWYKVSDLKPGVEIAVPSEKGQAIWDEILSITPVGREKVYDIEVEGTHNFVGNGIFAHNTYVLRANTMLAVTGEVNAGSFVIPIGGQTSTTTAEIPSSVLTADGKGVDLYKLSTYNLAAANLLAARVDAEKVKMASLESRVTALESGAISSSSNVGIGTSTLTSALSDLGVLIQRGIAQFNTLVFRQLVASKDADGTSSAGSVSILTGNTVAQVNNSLVLPSTKIFVTFNSQIAGSWWVSDKAAGSFRVVLSAAQAGDVSFDYFLVQTEGQIATSTPSSLQPPASSSQSDTTAPVITLLGDNPVRLSVGGSYAEPGITIVDDTDPAPTSVTFIDGVQMEVGPGTIDTSVETTHIITYSATDKKGNLATATRAVIVGTSDSGGQTTDSGSSIPVSDSPSSGVQSDTTAPTITLLGDAALELTVGDSFADPGATASDDTDGDITAKIVVSGNVDITKIGLYPITYTATDSAGNSASVSRAVSVVSSPSAPASTASTTSTTTAQPPETQ